jgi:hypothetical protein
MYHSTSAQTPKGMKENSLVRGQLSDRKKEKEKKKKRKKKCGVGL